jgi:hypothetical protein
MYMDAVVISSLVVVALVCVMATYIGIYAYKHVRVEIEREIANKKN